MAMSTEDRLAAQQARAAAAAAAAARIAAAAAPTATPLEKFLGQSGLPTAPPMHSRLYDIEPTPRWLEWSNTYGARLAAAENNARSNSAEWRAQVAAYNSGAPVLPDYWNLLNRMRLYFTGGEANPGRLTPEMAAPTLAQWARDAAPSALQTAVETATKVGLAVAAAVAVGDIAMSGTLISPGAAQAAVASTAPTVAAPVSVSQAAAVAYDPIAAMTGAGVGVSDAVAATVAASAPGVASAGTAIAEMQGAQWGALITGNVAAPVATIAEVAAKVPTQAKDLFTQPQAAPAPAPAAQPVIQSTAGGDMGSIFDNISGTISNIGSTVSSAYGTVLDTQIKMTQLDILKAQAKADLYPQPATGGVVSAGGMNIGMIAMVALALGGLMLYMRRG